MIEPQKQDDLPMKIPEGGMIRDARPDPHAKLTWTEWARADVFRRLLNDHRLRGHDAAFKLWHWYNNCKGKEGAPVTGHRSEAWYIARKFGWKEATVYKANNLLRACNYLAWSVGRGCVKAVRILYGMNEVPSEQADLPFFVPVSAPKGIPENTRSAPLDRPGMVDETLRSAQRGRPYIIREDVIKECERIPRPIWQIDEDIKRLERNRDEIRILPKEDPLRKTLRGINARIRDLRYELGGLAKPFEESPKLERKQSALEPAQESSPQRIKELADKAREAIDSPPGDWTKKTNAVT